MQDHAVATQAEQALDRQQFIFRTVTALGHQQLFTVGLGFGLDEIHQGAKEAPSV
ncbi:hypothetical protein D3C76_1642070 [compost metagenome]